MCGKFPCESFLQSGCISVGDVNCSLAGVPLVSALERDRYTHPEIHNSNDEGSCGKGRPGNVHIPMLR